MQVLLTSDARFERTPDGAVWGAQSHGCAVWSRYLDEFSSVLIAARVVDVRQPSAGYTGASAHRIRFCALPPYDGLGGLLSHLNVLRGLLTAAVASSPALIVRSPSALAFLTCRLATARRRRFAAEIIGDPQDVFSPGAFHHPLRRPVGWLATTAQRRVTRDAAAVLYVTQAALQRRYPTRGRMYAASDVALDDSAFATGPRPTWKPPAPFVLVTVGALDQPYKGTGLLLDALARLRQKGACVTLRIVGGGRLMPELRRDAAALGISQDVEFLGQQDRAGVVAALDSSHLFVLPSLTEGLPRALLEAMARGLPAVATEVGGIPELLPPECLVPPRQPQALAARIAEMMGDLAAIVRSGERNRREAYRHHERTQATIRRHFLRAVRDASTGHTLEARCA